MIYENTNEKVRLKEIDENKNYLVEEIKEVS